MSETKFGDQATPDAAKGAPEAIARASSDVIRQTTERARESMRRVSAASNAGAEAAMRTGASLAEGVQDVTTAWAHYAEEVMRQTTEAGHAMMGCRSLTDIFDIQSRLLQGNLQAFVDQSSKMAEIAGRIATRPFEAMKQASDDRRSR